MRRLSRSRPPLFDHNERRRNKSQLRLQGWPVEMRQRWTRPRVSAPNGATDVAWAPIPVARVDIDADTDLTLNMVTAGQRLWVEFERRGQVVGIVEATAEQGGLSREVLASLSRQFDTVPVESTTEVADDELPFASVVVPTICADSEQLALTIQTLKSLDYPRYEILVVDNRTDSPRTPLPILPEENLVRILHEHRRGVSAARNQGIANATGDFVAFTDDDVIVDARWLRELGSRFVRSPHVDGVGGLVLPLELRTPSQLWFEEFFGGFNQTFTAEVMSMELLAGVDALFPYSPGRFGAGCNMAFRRSALQLRGGFDVRLGTGTPSRGGEDLAMFMKQVFSGAAVAFEPRAVVHHQHRVTEKAFFKQVVGYGTGLSAMFTALVVKDPRHIPRIVRRVPAGYRILTKSRTERSPSSRPSYPSRTYAYHLLGLANGPFAYARSVAQAHSIDKA